jgi:hypothetical protein
MKLTSDLFADFLKCPTKCYLRSTGQVGTGNAYAEWVREQKDDYRAEAGRRLMAELPEAEVAVAPAGTENLKTATWRLAVDLPIETETMASRLHAVERVLSQDRGVWRLWSLVSMHWLLAMSGTRRRFSSSRIREFGETDGENGFNLFQPLVHSVGRW